MGKLVIIDPRKGDETLTWKPEDEKATEKAKKKFDKLKGKGYLAYKVVKETVSRAGEQVREFDPNMGEVIMRPQQSGG